MRAKLNIYRFDPDSNEPPRYDTFEIDTDPGETVLSALIKVNEDFDSSLSFRFACGKVKCGECPNQAFAPVTDQAVLDHLQDRHVMGVYPLLEDDTCWFLAGCPRKISVYSRRRRLHCAQEENRLASPYLLTPQANK